MSDPWRPLRPALTLIVAAPRLGERPTLDDLARAVHLSRYHFHRRFAQALGETSKQLVDRVRLSRAAAALLLDVEPVVDVAIRHGYASHEGFTRAFARQFGLPPNAYRQRGLLGVAPGQAEPVARHAQVVTDVAACVRLYRREACAAVLSRPSEDPMTLQISTLDAPEQHALLVRRRTRMEEISQTLGEILPAVFAYAQRAGAPLAGPPVVRYVEMSPGSVTVEGGFPVAAPCSGEGEIEPGKLGGCRVVTGVHVGPYDRLREAYQALEAWMAEHGAVAAGPPWEQYLTDPGEVPDPEQWQTAIFWPITEVEG